MQELKIKNPHQKISDYIPVWLKIFWKTFVINYLGVPHHQIIIPETPNHSAWLLGAQPCNYTIKKLLKKNPDKKIHIVSMLTNKERVITENNYLIKEGKIKITRTPWHDHSTLSLITGKNQTVKDMISLQKKLYADFTKTPPKEVFYCHCMAGRARSFVETMAFIYFYPDKDKLFDFENWPKEITKNISEDLKNRLKDDPSFSDIEEYIRIRRPNVKTLLKMDGDQAGLLGLMELHKRTNNLDLIKNRNEKRLYKDAQNIGMMLEMPLDLKFRDTKDLELQKENLYKANRAYEARDLDLLKNMIISIYENNDIKNYKNDFEKNLKKLNKKEQYRFKELSKIIKEKTNHKQLL